MTPRLLAALALTLPLALACGPKPTGSECSGAKDGDSCEGTLCLALNPNAQGKAGICSKACQSDDDCGSGDLCIDIDSSSADCFQSCQHNGDCRDGFVCIALDDGSAACIVEASDNSGGGGGGGPADCASKDCDVQTDSGSIDGYCSDKAGTTQVCDCPTTDVPAGCTLSTTGAANLYCCP